MSDAPGLSEPATTQTESTPGGGSVPLIVTKTQVPRRRPDLLPRHRLVSFLHAHLDRKLILISAPAGYGKTTLLADFAHDTDLPVCWYTLDPFDRDLHVFLEYLISAIARRFPAFGERSRALLGEVADPGSNLYPVVATLVQEIYDTIPEYFVLVLDDHHTVEHQEQINEFLELFVTYVDENCHLILASRTLPALPNLSLLVARRQAAGLSIDELRFALHEIQALAQQNYGLELSLSQAEILAQQTGGWITGLLLTAVPHWQRAQRDVPVEGPIGVDLYDYFSRQVLDQQPAWLRNFLLASSVLDELSPELCMSVLEIDRPSDLIDQVRMRNLFVVEFEGDVSRLRYHDLFRDFLQSCLRRQDGNRYRELTHRAAETYASRGEWERAVSRYLTLQEYEPVVDIVDRSSGYLFDGGRWDTLAGWIDALPESIRDAQPHFLFQRGKIHAERGEHTAALALFDRAERAFTTAGDRPRAAHVLVTKGSVLRFQGRYAEAIDHCRQALVLATGDTTLERSAMALAHKNIGLCWFRLGRLAKGRKALLRALRIYEELADPYNVGMVHHDLGLGHELAGDLTGAVDHYQAALAYWQRLGNLSAWANTLNGLGVVYYLQGQYDQALAVLTEALSRAQQARDLRIEAYALASLGDLHRDVGEYEGAHGTYAQALEIARRAHLGFVVTYALDGLGNVARLQGDLTQARKRLYQAMEYAEDHGSAYLTGLCHTSLGILANEQGDLVAARHHLDRAVEILESGGFQQPLGRACLHRAQATFLAGERQMVLADLERALDLAVQLGFDQFLVVDGRCLRPLLRFAAGQGLRDDVLTDLLERIEAHRAQASHRPAPVIRAQPEPALKIYALGPPDVEVDGQGVQWPVARSRDLFFLLLQHPQGLGKEQIGAMFWPEHDPGRLDSAFRSTLYRLRRVVFRDSVVFEDGVYRFNSTGNYWFDADAFERLLDGAGQAAIPEEASGLLEEALALYRGDYLEGIYADWSLLERERLRGRYLAALEALAGLYADRRKLQRAVELYQRLLAEDPYQEVAHRGLMRCYYRLGDRAAAVRQYQICAELLREELGLSPTPETEALYLQIIG
jgi:LuxR family maltose regulon positive regulatory protein